MRHAELHHIPSISLFHHWFLIVPPMETHWYSIGSPLVFAQKQPRYAKKSYWSPVILRTDSR